VEDSFKKLTGGKEKKGPPVGTQNRGFQFKSQLGGVTITGGGKIWFFYTFFVSCIYDYTGKGNTGQGAHQEA